MRDEERSTEYPKDTNGEWQRVKGTDVVHRGDYVPLQGIKGTGSANIYFNGYAKNKHIEKEVTAKTKPLVNLAFICTISGIICGGLGILEIIPLGIGLTIGILLGCLSALFLIIGLKLS